MHFNFHVELNDKDYFDYNTFWMNKSPYGKKRILILRILIVAIFSVAAFASLFKKEPSYDILIIKTILYAIAVILYELLLKPFLTFNLKHNIKARKKIGELGYSPVSEIEFYDESFIEIRPNSKTEQKYTLVERLSVISDKAIYIHVNKTMSLSYILPLSCFESKEQYHNFLEFMKDKGISIDVY